MSRSSSFPRLRRWAILLAALGVVAGPLTAASAPSGTPPPVYKVYIWQENGDCLWRIAEHVYGDRHKWPLIYQANRDVIKDPNKVYPGQRLKIPPADWQP